MREDIRDSRFGWLTDHRTRQPYHYSDPPSITRIPQPSDGLENVPTAFNDHAKNTGSHISPFDTGIVAVGTDGLEVRLAQGIDWDQLKQVVAAGSKATIGRPRPKSVGPMSDQMEISDDDWQEMFKGGLQTALESQTLVFEVWGASRILTHQLVRSRRAGFHQQSQRATWMGDRPEVRMPETVWRADPVVREQWLKVYMEAWKAYSMACDFGVPYEDARYILPEGTVNYIQCEYTIREFLNVFAYRGCSMFLREMVVVMRAFRDLVLAVAPWMEPYVKISCEKGTDCLRCKGKGKVPGGIDFAYPEIDVRSYTMLDCPDCKGIGSNRKCTFQGWENVELACSFPWAREDNRTFLANPKLRIGA